MIECVLGKDRGGVGNECPRVSLQPMCCKTSNMAARHVDVNERRLRPVYGTYYHPNPLSLSNLVETQVLTFYLLKMHLI